MYFVNMSKLDLDWSVKTLGFPIDLNVLLANSVINNPYIPPLTDLEWLIESDLNAPQMQYTTDSNHLEDTVTKPLLLEPSLLPLLHTAPLLDLLFNETFTLLLDIPQITSPS